MEVAALDGLCSDLFNPSEARYLYGSEDAQELMSFLCLWETSGFSNIAPKKSVEWKNSGLVTGIGFFENRLGNGMFGGMNHDEIFKTSKQAEGLLGEGLTECGLRAGVQFGPAALLFHLLTGNRPDDNGKTVRISFLFSNQFGPFVDKEKFRFYFATKAFSSELKDHELLGTYITNEEMLVLAVFLTMKQGRTWDINGKDPAPLYADSRISYYEAKREADAEAEATSSLLLAQDVLTMKTEAEFLEDTKKALKQVDGHADTVIENLKGFIRCLLDSTDKHYANPEIPVRLSGCRPPKPMVWEKATTIGEHGQYKCTSKEEEAFGEHGRYKCTS